MDEKMAKMQLSSDSRKPDTKSGHELQPWPEYIEKRLILWDKFMQEYKDELAAKAPEPITISLPDGRQESGESWRTSPSDIAKRISQGLSDQAVISKVDGELWDLERPLEKSCKLELLKFDDDEAKQVFWHSSAHVLGEAMERYYGGYLCYGPPIENGFYYDMYHGDNADHIEWAKTDHFPRLQEICQCAVKDKQPFERLELTKPQLLELFGYNRFKVRILENKVTQEKTTAYRCGPLIDLCRGPHVRHTGKLKSIHIYQASSAFWEGNSEAETLQRIYGVSFPDAKQLKEWIKFREEAASRDHRKLGRDQELFCFNPLSPGSAFFFPRGAHIYNTLLTVIRQQYRKRGYTEVISPNIYNFKLWDTSGHGAHYKKNMFCFEVEKEEFALKPMNCPGHCLMYAHKPRTHKELPMRYADFGVLHRNEVSGALSGLTRVRRFQQDDAHIFCRMDQIVEEIKGCLDFLKYIYVDVFGFTYKLYLSTRPEDGYLGETKTWDDAEACLTQALNEFDHPWALNPGDGAFYGPKIDITIFDALRRQHQCATIQLDFQLPVRFSLTYTDENGEHQRPVIVHRAILGSLERMIAILTENFGGKWPFWLSPRQAVVMPVHESFDDYCRKVKDDIYAAGFECDLDLDPGDTMNKKIRNNQLAQYNFILVVGEREVNNGTVNVRTRDNKVHGEFTVPNLIERFKRLSDEKVLNSEEAL